MTAPPHVVLIHGGESTGKKLQQLLPSAVVTVIYEPGLSSAYDEKTGLAYKYPTLQGLMAAHAPSWRSGDPLVVLAYSAGGWALRYYLRDAGAREDVNAAIFLDSLYSAGGACGPYDGVIEFAKLAQADSTQHRLIMTYSQAHPGPGICSEYIAKLVGGGSGPGVFVEAAPNADHGGQQGIVGPQVVEKYVVGWLPEGRRREAWWKPSNTAIYAGAVLLSAFGGMYFWRRRQRP